MVHKINHADTHDRNSGPDPLTALRYGGIIAETHADSSVVGSTSGAQAGDVGALTIPALAYAVAGDRLIYRANGDMQNTNAAINHTWKLTLGGTAVPTNGLNAVSVAANANPRLWQLEALLVLIATNSVYISWRMFEENASAAASAAGAQNTYMGGSPRGSPLALDMTVSRVIAFNTTIAQIAAGTTDFFCHAASVELIKT